MNNQEALKNLISNKLDEQGLIHNVDFNTVLYNREEIKYYKIDDNGQKNRFVPTIINDVVGEYLNVPNANSTSNDTSIEFDIMIDYDSEYDNITETEIEKVGYQNTKNAIEGFKNTLLAQYFPLGTPYLYMGGEDSGLSAGSTIVIPKNFIYLNFIPYNTDEETIFDFDDSTEQVLYKDATHLNFQIETGAGVSIPYTVNEEIELTITYNSTTWTITDGINSDSAIGANTVVNDVFNFGGSTGFEGIIKRFAISPTYYDSIDDATDLSIDLVDWTSKSVINNSGDLVVTGSIDNSILWSEDGNAIFGFGTLSPTTGIRTVDDSFLYQAFELPLSVFISNDVLFGNNFEYYLDGEQIYPIDRQITLATELGSGQYINNNENEHIVEESSREHTISFYYIPNKKLNSLLKHVVTGDIPQNTTYQLLVQYPFFKVTYDVILENGGTQPNINTLSTLTLTFKKKDSSLT